MKVKIWIAVKGLFIMLIVAAMIHWLFNVADTWLNGMFIDWFERRFVSYSLFFAERGDNYSVADISYYELKSFVIMAASVLAMVWTATLLITSVLVKNNAVKKTVLYCSRLIKQYISEEKSVTDIFPEEYVDIGAQISELKFQMRRNEQELRDETSKKNELLVYLAHDLKTPLTSVIGYLSLLDEVPDMPQEQRAKYIYISLEKAQRLEKLINEFFDITRYNLHEVLLDKEFFDLSYMLYQMADEFYPVLREHGNSIQVQTPDELIVYADPVKLARVFNNILKNAVSYSYSNTEIVVFVAHAENGISISFRNHGRTIPVQRLESIFEKFFRLDDARNTNSGGAGLGLAIAREIVELHGGTITAISQSEETVFMVYLPM